MKINRRLIIKALLLTISLLVLAVAGLSLFFDSLIWARIQSELKTRYQIELAIGNLHWSQSKNEFEIENFQLQKKTEGQKIDFKFKRLILNISLQKLWERQVQIQNLYIEHPYLVAQVQLPEPDNTPSAPSDLTALSPEVQIKNIWEQLQRPSIPVSIDNLHIDHLHLNIDIRQQPGNVMKAQIDSADFKMHLHWRDGSFDFANEVNCRIPDLSFQTDNKSDEKNLASNAIQIRNLKWNAQFAVFMQKRVLNNETTKIPEIKELKLNSNIDLEKLTHLPSGLELLAHQFQGDLHLTPEYKIHADLRYTSKGLDFKKWPGLKRLPIQLHLTSDISKDLKQTHLNSELLLQNKTGLKTQLKFKNLSSDTPPKSLQLEQQLTYYPEAPWLQLLQASPQLASAAQNYQRLQLSEPIKLKIQYQKAVQSRDAVKAQLEIPQFAYVSPKPIPKLQNLNITLDLSSPSLQNANEAIDLKNLHIKVQQPELEGKFIGRIFGANQQAQLKAYLNADLNPKWVHIPGQRVGGGIQFNSDLMVLPHAHGREISINGKLHLKNLDWHKENNKNSKNNTKTNASSDEMALIGLAGDIPISEHILWNDKVKNISFIQTLNQNPFERVDFDRLQPLLELSSPVRINRIHWVDKSFGPFEAFLSIKQNMLMAQRYDLNLHQGRWNGQMFFNFDPKQLQFGLMSRLTNLNLIEILPSHFTRRMKSQQALLSARTGFVFQMQRDLLEGRADITQLGPAPLLAMINTLDPLYEDEKMNKVRSLLEIGHPTHVDISFTEGLMNMTIGIDIAGLQQTHSIYGIPITAFMSKMDALKQFKGDH